MPANLEIKVKLNSFDEAVASLNSIDAEYKGVLNQKDIYYSNPGYLLKLRIENGSSSLIKYNRAEADGEERWSDYTILNFSDGNTEEFLKDLFDVEAVVQKKRTLYLYKETRIHLDEVKDLGNFLELEAVLTNSKEESKEQFNFLVDVLHLKDKEEFRLSYRDLFLEKAK